MAVVAVPFILYLVRFARYRTQKPKAPSSASLGYSTVQYEYSTVRSGCEMPKSQSYHINPKLFVRASVRP